MKPPQVPPNVETRISNIREKPCGRWTATLAKLAPSHHAGAALSPDPFEDLGALSESLNLIASRSLFIAPEEDSLHEPNNALLVFRSLYEQWRGRHCQGDGQETKVEVTAT